MARSPRTSRRDFLAFSAGGAAASMVPSGIAAAARPQETPTADAADPAGGADLRIAVVGVRGRGWSHVQGFASQPGCRVVALCDVDSKVLADRAAQCAKGENNRPGFEVETTGDVRTLLGRDDIDAIAIATPNHTHAMLACWALDAGKHVYVEKPVSHHVEEGARIVEAATRSGRICATGTQGRSSAAVRGAIEFIHGGGLGRVHCSRGLCYKPRRSIGRVDGPQFVPATVDYDRWLGPVGYAPLHRGSLHYDWHWDLHTGNGDLGNQGIHQMDIARWALGWNALPDRVDSVGGRLGYVDDGDSPNTQVAVFDCGPSLLVFEVRGLPKDKAAQSGSWQMDEYEGVSIGNLVHGEHGTVRISNSYTWADFIDRDGVKQQEWKGGGDHFANFVAAVRANDPTMLTASIEDGHLSSAFCHLGILSHELGRKVAPRNVYTEWTSQTQIPDPRDEFVLDAWGRMRDHLVANGVDLDATPVTLGRRLRIDPKTGTIIDDPTATARLSRTAREPFNFG